MISKWVKGKVNNLKLLYRGTRDGFSASSFHSKVDAFSNVVTIMKSGSGKRFGGVIDGSWKQD